MVSLISRLYHTACLFWHIFRDLSGSLRDRIHRRLAHLKGEGSPLVIGWDAFPFHEPLTGVGWYAYHLLKEISGRDDIVINLYGNNFKFEEEGSGLHIDLETLGSSVRMRSHGIPPRLLIPRGLALKLLKGLAEPLFQVIDGNDLLFSPNFFPPPRLTGSSHTLITTIHDLTYRRFPEYVQKETLDNLNFHMPGCVYHAAAIIAVSNNTAEDIEHYFPGSSNRVFPIHSGVDPPRGSGPDPVEGPYLLFVSTVEPRKNLDTLLEAFTIVKRGGYTGKLVIAGKIGWKSEATVKNIDKHPYRDDVKQLDYVSREKLGNLYKYADIFIFPSHYEGFGFPLLEAMANGCPVISASNSSLPEVGGEACMLVNEKDPEAIAKAVREILSSPDRRSQLVERGLERVKSFQWSNAADQTLSLFKNHA